MATPPVSENARKPTAWGLIVMLGCLTAMGPLGIDMYLPGLPAMGRELRASPAIMEATVSTFLAGMALGQLFYGPAADRFGRRPPILIGIVIFVFASIACALAPSAEVLLVARFVQALGACAGSVVVRAIVRDRFNHSETAQVFSLMMLIFGLAPVLAPLVGGALLAVTGWRAIFWVLTASGLLLGGFAFLRLKETRTAETAALAASEHPLRAFASLLRSKRLVAYMLSGGLNGATMFTYVASSPELLITNYGVAPSWFGVVFGINAVGMIAVAQINRRLLKSHTPDDILARSSFLSLGVAIILALSAFTGIGGRWTFLPMLFLMVSAYGLVQANSMASALSIDLRRAGSISALMGGVSFACGALGSAVTGMLHDGTPRPMATVILGCTAMGCLILQVWGLPPESRLAFLGRRRA